MADQQSEIVPTSEAEAAVKVLLNLSEIKAQEILRKALLGFSISAVQRAVEIVRMLSSDLVLSKEELMGMDVATRIETLEKFHIILMSLMEFIRKVEKQSPSHGVSEEDELFIAIKNMSPEERRDLAAYLGKKSDRSPG